MNDLISREAAIDSIYKNHMNGKKGVKQDVENLYGSAVCFSETLQDAVESIEELPTVPAIPISVIEQIKADIADLNKYKFPGCGESLYYNAAEVDFIIYSILKECKE